MGIPQAPQTDRARPHAEPGVDEDAGSHVYNPIDTFEFER
jgi:hypothetical protein